MSKIYLFTEDANRKLLSAILDLEKLPLGVSNTTVRAWDEQIIDVGRWFSEKPERAARITKRLALNELDEETISFCSDLASFVENCPPSSMSATDWILGTFGSEKAELMRVTSEFAEKMYIGMKLGKLPDR